MIIPVIIGFDAVVEEFELSTMEEEKLMDYAVKSVVTVLARNWDALAKQKLKQTKNEYRRNLSVGSNGPGTAYIKLSGVLPNMIENGAAPFDMKVGFLKSPKAKMGINGPFMSIPFRHGVPTTLGESSVFSEVMPEDIYTLARKGKVEEKDVPSGYKHRKRKKIVTENKVFEEYAHKSSIYAGMQRKTPIDGGGGTYMSFRRVSQKSDPMAFIHSGFQPMKLSEEALNNTDVPTIVDRATDKILSEIRSE